MHRAGLQALLLVALVAVTSCKVERKQKSRTAQLVSAALQEYMAIAKSKAAVIRSQVLEEFYNVVSDNATMPDGKKDGGGTLHGLLETFKGNIIQIAHRELHFDAEEIGRRVLPPFNTREKRRGKSKSEKGSKGSNSASSSSNNDEKAANSPQSDLQVSVVQ